MASLKNISFGESGCFDKLVSGHFGLLLFSIYSEKGVCFGEIVLKITFQQK